MEIGIKKTVNINVKKLSLQIKVTDRFYADLIDEQGEVVGNIELDVPNFFPGDHYGEYLYLDIDIETGQVTNWNKPTAKQIEAIINGDNED
ncbi:hypothetical protein [uncultured Gilliamella sp.]|uniref:hypothetical protein n=1 Tax=uncultured Gilliamella sp. TaxID=1193505 RepID=UPI0025E1BD68|nr:hypothetical protein [uncultured Gilliamella sp.]